jgi:hypothetical protein
MSFLGGVIHGAIEGAGESGGNRQPSTFELGANLHAQHMNARRRREKALQAECDRINAENARMNQQRIAQERAFYNSPAQVERRRRVAIEDQRIEAESRARHEAHLARMAALDAHSAKMIAEMDADLRAHNARDAAKARKKEQESIAYEEAHARELAAMDPEVRAARRAEARASLDASSALHKATYCFSNRFKRFLAKRLGLKISYLPFCSGD